MSRRDTDRQLLQVTNVARILACPEQASHSRIDVGLLEVPARLGEEVGEQWDCVVDPRSERRQVNRRSREAEVQIAPEPTIQLCGPKVAVGRGNQPERSGPPVVS